MDLNKQNKAKSTYTQIHQPKPFVSRDNYYNYIQGQLNKFSNYIAISNKDNQKIHFLEQLITSQQQRIKKLQNNSHLLELYNYQNVYQHLTKVNQNQKGKVSLEKIVNIETRVRKIQNSIKKGKIPQASIESCTQQEQKIEELLVEVRRLKEIVQKKQENFNSIISNKLSNRVVVTSHNDIHKKSTAEKDFQRSNSNKNRERTKSKKSAADANIQHAIEKSINMIKEQLKVYFDKKINDQLEQQFFRSNEVMLKFEKDLKEYFVQKFDKVKKIIFKSNKKIIQKQQQSFLPEIGEAYLNKIAPKNEKNTLNIVNSNKLNETTQSSINKRIIVESRESKEGSSDRLSKKNKNKESTKISKFESQSLGVIKEKQKCSTKSKKDKSVQKSHRSRSRSKSKSYSKSRRSSLSKKSHKQQKHLQEKAKSTNRLSKQQKFQKIPLNTMTFVSKEIKNKEIQQRNNKGKLKKNNKLKSKSKSVSKSRSKSVSRSVSKSINKSLTNKSKSHSKTKSIDKLLQKSDKLIIKKANDREKKVKKSHRDH